MEKRYSWQGHAEAEAEAAACFERNTQYPTIYPGRHEGVGLGEQQVLRVVQYTGVWVRDAGKLKHKQRVIGGNKRRGSCNTARGLHAEHG